MLTISAFWSSVNRQLPRVNYAKAVDYYFIVSFVFIMLTLVEFTVVLNTNFDAIKTEGRKKKASKDTIKRQNSQRSSVLPVKTRYL